MTTPKRIWLIIDGPDRWVSFDQAEADSVVSELDNGASAVEMVPAEALRTARRRALALGADRRRLRRAAIMLLRRLGISRLELRVAEVARDQWCKDFGHKSEEQADGLERESVLRAALSRSRRTVARLRRAVLGLAARSLGWEAAVVAEVCTCAEGDAVSERAAALMLRARDQSHDGDGGEKT